jgi:hypothetical protein
MQFSVQQWDKLAYPGTLSQAVEAELVCDLGGVHGILH